MNRQNKKFVRELRSSLQTIVDTLTPHKDMLMCDDSHLGDCMIPEIDTGDEELSWAKGLEEKYDNLIQGIHDVWSETQQKVDDATDAFMDSDSYDRAMAEASLLEEADKMLQWNSTIYHIISVAPIVDKHIYQAAV